MHQQKGQVLLVVILAIVAASTVGLSILSRTITSQKSSTEEAESQKALAAAEAGIERAIQTQVQGNITISSNGDIGNNSEYDAKVTQFENASSFLLNGGTQIKDSAGTVIKTIPNIVQKDEGADVWFAQHDDITGDIIYPQDAPPLTHLNLYWGTTSESCMGTKPAAIEVIVVAGTSAGTAKTYKYAYDSCSSQRGNNFKPGLTNDSTGWTVPGIDLVTSVEKVAFGNKTPVDNLARGVGNIILMRVIPLYKDTIVGISTCDASGSNCTPLPSPGSMIVSTGTSGQASRKVSYFKAEWPQTYLPYLSYGLFVAN